MKFQHHLNVLGFCLGAFAYTILALAKLYPRDMGRSYDEGVKHGFWMGVKATEHEFQTQSNLRPDGDGENVADEAPGASPAET